MWATQHLGGIGVLLVLTQGALSFCPRPFFFFSCGEAFWKAPLNVTQMWLSLCILPLLLLLSLLWLLVLLLSFSSSPCPFSYRPFPALPLAQVTARASGPRASTARSSIPDTAATNGGIPSREPQASPHSDLILPGGGGRTVLCCAVLYCSALCFAVLCLCSAVLNCTELNCTVMCRTTSC